MRLVVAVLQDLVRALEDSVSLEAVHEVGRLLERVVHCLVLHLLYTCILPVIELEKAIVAQGLDRLLLLVLLDKIVGQI